MNSLETSGPAVVAAAARLLGRLGLTQGALGHVSSRIEGSERMWIKSKGPEEVGLRYTEEEDVIEVDFDCNAISDRGGLRPPSESFIHSWIYKLHPEVGSVIHLHPAHAVLLTICDKPIKPIYGAFGGGARIAIDGVPTYPRSVRVLDDERGEEFAKFMSGKKVGLMRGHGVTVTGATVQDAAVRAVEFDELATMNYRAYLLGEPQSISDADIEELRAPATELGRGSAGGQAGVLAKWRYLCRLAGEMEPSRT